MYAGLWLGFVVLALIVEAVVPGLISIWFAFGGLAALIVAVCGGSLGLQIILFLVVSILSLAVTRPLAVKYVNNKTEPTNADRYVGKDAAVTEEISFINGTGRVKIDGQDWAARCENESDEIKEGNRVKILRIEGSKLIVAKHDTKTITEE